MNDNSREAENAARLVATKLVVEDLAAQTIFYVSALGYIEAQSIRADLNIGAIHEVILRSPTNDQEMLVLLRYEDRPAPPPGGSILAFQVADLQASIRKVLMLGGREIAPWQHMREMNLDVVFLADPEGHTIELYQVVPLDK